MPGESMRARNITGVSRNHVLGVLVVSGRVWQLILQWRAVDRFRRFGDGIAKLVSLSHATTVVCNARLTKRPMRTSPFSLLRIFSEKKKQAAGD